MTSAMISVVLPLSVYNQQELLIYLIILQMSLSVCTLVYFLLLQVSLYVGGLPLCTLTLEIVLVGVDVFVVLLRVSVCAEN